MRHDATLAREIDGASGYFGSSRKLYETCSRLIEAGTQEAEAEFLDLCRRFRRNPDEVREQSGKWRTEMRSYKRAWAAARQRKVLKQIGACARCGSTANIELDHINPATKTCHKIRTWAEHRQQAELAKCQALCRKCHTKKSALELVERAGARVLTRADVAAIQLAHANGEGGFRRLGLRFGIDHKTVAKIVRGTYRAIKESA